MGCDAGAADGGFGLLRIAWGVGMTAGAVLAELGSAGLSTGESRAVVHTPTPEGGGVVVDPVWGSDGASGRHAGGAGRIAGRLGVTGAAVAMVLVSRLLGAFAGSDPVASAGEGGDDPARGETVPAVRAPHTRWIMKGKASKPVELGAPLTVLEGQYPLILDWCLQWHGGTCFSR